MPVNEQYRYPDSETEQVHIIGVYGLELTPEARVLYASALGRTARVALKRMVESQDTSDEAGVATTEMITNAFLYDNGVSELTMRRTEHDGKASLDVATTSPTVLTEGAPAVENFGTHVAETGNEFAEHGRGVIIVNAFSDGNWRQVNEELSDGSHVLRTSATFSDVPRHPRPNGNPPDEISKAA